MKNLIKKTGLALDIDETLSSTNVHWFRSMINRFGNPEGLSAEKIAEKYRYAQRVPYWQTKEAEEWMEEKRHSNEMQMELPLIENANHTVEKINKIIPIVAYITIRPHTVEEGTKHWLLKHNFPEAQVIFRPKEVPFSEGNKWKAKILQELYPKVIGIIDDNPELLTHLKTNYKGTIFVYNMEKINTSLHAIPCKDWKTTVNEVKKEFGK
jgi:hypothetical protein